MFALASGSNCNYLGCAMKRYLLNIASIVAGLVMTAVALVAQPVLVDVRLTQPPMNQVKIADLWKIELVNRSRQTIRIYLRGTAEEMSVPDGIVAEAHSAEFDVPPGIFRVTAAGISPITHDQSNPRYREALLTTGNVPTGDYKICVEAYEVETQQMVGFDCKFTTVNRMSAPILISPVDESAVPDKFPVFTWMASVPPGPGQRIKYKITVAEILGRQTPEDAVTRNPAWFTQRNLERTLIQYPVSSRSFVKGQKYAWKVEAYEERGTMVVPLGESEVWWFTYEPFGEGDGGDVTAVVPTQKKNDQSLEKSDECPGENWDFEIGTLGCWEVQGESFFDDPVLDKHPVFGAVGPQGKYWVSSYGQLSSDKAQGTMISVDFRIQNSTITFLFGGVPNENCRVELLLERIESDTFSFQKRTLPGSSSTWFIANSTPMSAAASSDRFTPVEWDVLPYLNRNARILVIDSSEIGHVNVDDFKFYDKEKLDKVKYPVQVMSAGERHSLVGTPASKPAGLLQSSLLDNLEMVKAGDIAIQGVMVVNETSPAQKGHTASSVIGAGAAMQSAKVKDKPSGSFQAGGTGGQSADNDVGAGSEAKPMIGGTVGGVAGGFGGVRAVSTDNIQVADLSDVEMDKGIKSVLDASALAKITDKGKVWGWGDNLFNVVRGGFGSVVKEPKQITDFEEVMSLEAGVWNSFAVDKKGVLKGWGRNNFRQLGLQDENGRSTPTTIPGVANVVKVSSGPFHTVAINKSGQCYVWGWNRAYACGFPANLHINPTTNQIDSSVYLSVPALYPKLQGVVDIAAGEGHTLSLNYMGRVYAWGNNCHGQTGASDDEAFTTVPTSVTFPGYQPIYGGKGAINGFVAVAAGFDHSLALNADGKVWAWGGNASGQLGDGETEDRAQPKIIPDLHDIRAIAAGDGFSLALDSSGVVWAWGNNVLGQLGDGTRVGKFKPVKVARLEGAQGIVAGGAHAMAVLADGSLWTWGNNSFGQLGEGNIINLVPVPLNPAIGPLRVERLATK